MIRLDIPYEVLDAAIARWLAGERDVAIVLDGDDWYVRRDVEGEPFATIRVPQAA